MEGYNNNVFDDADVAQFGDTIVIYDYLANEYSIHNADECKEYFQEGDCPSHIPYNAGVFFHILGRGEGGHYSQRRLFPLAACIPYMTKTSHPLMQDWKETSNVIFPGISQTSLLARHIMLRCGRMTLQTLQYVSLTYPRLSNGFLFHIM